MSRAGRPKSNEKREAVLRAAVDLFLTNGFKETSMEKVANVSGVSKQTVYSHFENKEKLFLAVIAFKCEEYSLNLQELAGHDEGLEHTLSVVCSRFVGLFQDEEVVSMFAVIIAEARNSPRVGELFYQAGPLASVNSISEIIFNLSQQDISESDARMLAGDFFGLLKGQWHMRSLMNLDYEMDEKQRNQCVKTVVDKTMVLLNHYYS